jgi:molybdate transport system substrate-binding protein
MTIHRLFIIGLLLCVTAGTAWSGRSQGPTIAAALSLKGAFEEVGALYERNHPGEHVQFNFAASGVLQQQIEGGAPVDVFASAAAREMDELDRKQMLETGSRRIFAGNGIVLIVAGAGKAGIRSFAELALPSVRRIAIGNPATVPAGKYAEEVLRHAAVWDGISDRLVLCENVRQVLDYTVRSEVDAGILFATDAAGVAGITVAEKAPAGSHSPAAYHIAIIKDAEHRRAGRAFIDLLLSPEGQAILKRRGFLAAP